MKLAAALGIVYVVWGSTYLAIAVADRTLPPLLMLSVRFLIAGALLYAGRGAAARSPPSGRAGASGAPPRSSAACCSSSTPAASPGPSSASRPASRRSSSRASRSSWRCSIAPSSASGCRSARSPASRRASSASGCSSAPSGHVDASAPSCSLGASFAWAAGSAYARVAPLPGRRSLAGDADALRRALLGARRPRAGRARRACILSRSRRVARALSSSSSSSARSSRSPRTAGCCSTRSTSLLSTYAYVNPAVAVFLGWAFVGEHVGGREIAAGVVILLPRSR